MIQDPFYPCLCNTINTPSLPGKLCQGTAVQPLCSARCRLMSEGTKPVLEHTSQVQHLTLIGRYLMTMGIKKTESFVTAGWQFWGFASLEQSDINKVYLKRDWHLWWTDLISGMKSHQKLTILCLSTFLLQLQGCFIYLACFNENICKIWMWVILIFKDEAGHITHFSFKQGCQNKIKVD